MTEKHKNNPEIWLRPSPNIPLPVLSGFVESRLLKATPRLGARDSTHPKGYEPGQTVTLLVLDNQGEEHLRLFVRIEAVTIRQLSQLTPGDLKNTLSYHSWKEVRDDFELFENRPISEAEQASIIEFSYI